MLSSQRQLRREPEPVIRVSQEGTRVSVFGEHRCRTYVLDQVETTNTFSRTSTMPGMMVTLGIAGALGVTGGSLLAANVFGFPPPSRAGMSDGFDADTALISGIALIVAGAAALTLTAIHGFGLLATDDETTQQIVDRGPSGDAIACAPAEPLSGAHVALAGDRRAQLGMLSTAGELSVDAAALITPAFVLEHAGQRVPLSINGRESGASIDMQPLQLDVDERVWARAETTRCAAADDPSDCRALERYLELFPSGAHADEGRALLAQAQTRLAERARELEEERRAEEERRRAEAEAWQLEQERQRRLEQEQWEREERARQAAAEQRQREAAHRQARSECQRTCRSSCAGNAECAARCVAQQCR